MLKSDIDDLRKYIDILEDSLQQNLDEFGKKADDELKKYAHDPELESYMADELSDTYWQFAERFPNILRNSFLITCCSFLENQLNAICSMEKRKRSLKLDITDLSGKGAERARNYLKKVAGIDFPDDDSWNQIKNINSIRNFIVHNEGRLNSTENAKKIRLYIEKRSDISLDEHNAIILSANYCRHVVNTIEAFLISLLKRLGYWSP